MREMTGREVEMALADEKVQAIRPQLMTGAALITCISMLIPSRPSLPILFFLYSLNHSIITLLILSYVDQGEVTELAIELEEAITVISGFQKSLDEDLKTRTKLVDALKVYLEAQQQQKETTQKKLQVCLQFKRGYGRTLE